MLRCRLPRQDVSRLGLHPCEYLHRWACVTVNREDGNDDALEQTQVRFVCRLSSSADQQLHVSGAHALQDSHHVPQAPVLHSLELIDTHGLRVVDSMQLQVDCKPSRALRLRLASALRGMPVCAESRLMVTHNERRVSVRVCVDVQQGYVCAQRRTLLQLEQVSDALAGSSSSSSGSSSSSSSTAAADVPDVPKVAGLQQTLEALDELVSLPLQRANLFAELGTRAPAGVLLYGPPGVGKTLLVRAVAARQQVPLYVLDGSQLYSSVLGATEEALREAFAAAQAAASEAVSGTAILFIDELDVLCPPRDSSSQVEARVVAQLLTLLDGAHTSANKRNLLLLGASNHVNAIDTALRRPGRFDREVEIPVPDAKAREEILALYTAQLRLAEDVDLASLATMTAGYVGADLHMLCRHVALQSIRHSRPEIAQADFVQQVELMQPSTRRGWALERSSTTWQDLGGVEGIRKQLEQIEWPITHKEACERMGIEAPAGVLLYGPPGCAKTTMVRAVANRTGFAFVSLSGAAVYSSFVGEAERALRSVFARARLAAPSILFLDEVDALVGKRAMGGSGSSGGGDDVVKERMLSTLLNEMDGIEASKQVLVVGATNRPDMLDAALIRPGRFDQLIYVGAPDTEARSAILQVHARKVPVEDNVSWEEVAQRTEGFSGADLENLLREAALLAVTQALEEKGDSGHADSVCVGQVHVDECLAKMQGSLAGVDMRVFREFASR